VDFCYGLEFSTRCDSGDDYENLDEPNDHNPVESGLFKTIPISILRCGGGLWPPQIRFWNNAIANWKLFNLDPALRALGNWHGR